jgi:hypothetical protein
MPWPERTILSRVLAGIVGGLLLSTFVFIVLTFNFFTFHSPTAVPLMGAAIGGCVGLIAGYIGGDRVVRALAQLLGGSRAI